MSLKIPDQFLGVKYNSAHYPGAPGVNGVVGGANCQQYAYAILRYFGRQIPDFRSSDLWEDVGRIGISKMAAV
jgi:murein DD-endopeptidase / murein LD-carboxypeptidase